MALPNFYTREELATKLKVSPRTIDRWEKEGKITAKRVSRTVRFSEEQVKRLLSDENTD